jgi:hypothetical protein
MRRLLVLLGLTLGMDNRAAAQAPTEHDAPEPDSPVAASDAEVSRPSSTADEEQDAPSCVVQPGQLLSRRHLDAGASRAARADLPVCPALPATAAEDDDAATSDRPFLRTRNGNFLLFPAALLQVDSVYYRGAYAPPKNGAFVRRARLELAGWVGTSVYFAVGGDFGAPPPAGSGERTTAMVASDVYLALAPWGDRLILQVGQFDAPFTLENRISDRHLAFTERALTARALGVPTNKEIGAMLHGVVGSRLLYYSVGAFNGDGPGFRNADNKVDGIGRLSIAPLGSTPWRSVRGVTVGGSFWSGRRLNGLALPAQSTQGGYKFFEPRWTIGRGTPTLLELRQQGRIWSYAAELDIPIAHRFGLRAEYVFKHQQLSEVELPALSSGAHTVLGNAVLDGLAAYGELRWWIRGNDRILPAPGLQLPTRLGAAAADEPPPVHGLLLAVRGEYLKEDLVSDQPLLANPNTATGKLMSGSVAVSYWYLSGFRVTLNYVINKFGGTTENAKILAARMPFHHELILRFALSL